MKPKLIIPAVFLIMVGLVSLANATIEFNITPDFSTIDLSGQDTGHTTMAINVISLNETADFSMYLDVFPAQGLSGNAFRIDLRDGRNQQIVESFIFLDIYFPVYYTIDMPVLGPAAGDLGTFNGPYSIASGIEIEFIREQNIGYAPNGLIGSVTLTFVPEPATILMLSIGGILISRKHKRGKL